MVALLSVLGLCLRAAFALRSGIWRDEGLFLAIAGQPNKLDVLRFLFFHESHPPLYYFLMRGWLGLVGTSDMAALLPAIVLGTALIPVLYYVGRVMYGPRAGLLAAALGAVSPMLAEFAGMVRPYALMPLLGTFAVFALWHALLDGRKRAWAAYSALLVLHVYTHNFGWVVLASLALTSAGWLVANPPDTRRWRPWLAWILAHAAVVVAFLPWMQSLLHQVGHAGYPPLPGASLVGTTEVASLAFFTTSALWPHWVFVPFFGVLVGCGLLLRRPAARSTGLALLLTVGAPYLMAFIAAFLSSTSDLLLFRTLLTLAPAFLLACAACVSLVKGPRAFAAAAVVAVLALGYSLPAALGHPKSNARELAAALTPQVRPTDLVLVSPEFLAASFNHYFQPANPQLDFPASSREELTPFDDLAARLSDVKALHAALHRIQAQRQAGQRVWLVTEACWLNESSPAGEGLNPQAQLSPVVVAITRTTQLRRALVAAYGKARTQLAPKVDVTAGDENFQAFLYEP